MEMEGVKLLTSHVLFCLFQNVTGEVCLSHFPEELSEGQTQLPPGLSNLSSDLSICVSFLSCICFHIWTWCLT